MKCMTRVHELMNAGAISYDRWRCLSIQVLLHVLASRISYGPATKLTSLCASWSLKPKGDQGIPYQFLCLYTEWCGHESPIRQTIRAWKKSYLGPLANFGRCFTLEESWVICSNNRPVDVNMFLWEEGIDTRAMVSQFCTPFAILWSLFMGAGSQAPGFLQK